MSNSSDSDEEYLHAMRHSLAHIMATAVMRLWPTTKLGIGPVVENGFYYDIDTGGEPITEDDFKKIEKEMKKIVSANQAFEQSTKDIDEAITWAKENNQPYKEELLNDLKRSGTTAANDLNADELGTIAEGDSALDSVGFYTNGDFTDLCRGPHVESTSKVGSFKLLRVAGAYWRANEKNAQMQRLYGVAFATREELDTYLQNLEEAKKRDHRLLGKSMDLFTFSELVGSGLPMFTPRGTWLRELLGDYSQQIRSQYGFERVWTPHITKNDLYKSSGHWDKFGDQLLLVESQETSDSFVMKPMNCPHHIQIFSSKPRSYKDLPIKYMETTTNYRDEKSGELHGLSRVRALTQDDSHAFITEDGIETAVGELIDSAQEMYENLEMKLKINLSFRDSGDGYLGEKALWDIAEKALDAIATSRKMEFKVDPGEAAFYGPKIDFIAVDGLSREWQVATVQLDFVQPSRFELEYIDSDGNAKTPVMIHCAMLGSIERFLSVYIEHTAGHFPFWLAPEQVRVLPIKDTVHDYAASVEEQLKGFVLQKPLRHNELRFSVDLRNESLSRKIKDAQLLKVPVMLIVGERDKDAQTVSVRTQEGESTVALGEVKSFLESL